MEKVLIFFLVPDMEDKKINDSRAAFTAEKFWQKLSLSQADTLISWCSQTKVCMTVTCVACVSVCHIKNITACTSKRWVSQTTKNSIYVELLPTQSFDHHFQSLILNILLYKIYNEGLNSSAIYFQSKMFSIYLNSNLVLTMLCH